MGACSTWKLVSTGWLDWILSLFMDFWWRIHPILDHCLSRSRWNVRGVPSSACCEKLTSLASRFFRGYSKVMFSAQARSTSVEPISGTPHDLVLDVACRNTLGHHRTRVTERAFCPPPVNNFAPLKPNTLCLRESPEISPKKYPCDRLLDRKLYSSCSGNLVTSRSAPSTKGISKAAIPRSLANFA